MTPIKVYKITNQTHMKSQQTTISEALFIEVSLKLQIDHRLNALRMHITY